MIEFNYSGTGTPVSAWTQGYNGQIVFGNNSSGGFTIRSPEGAYVPPLTSGDTVTFAVQVQHSGFSESDFKFNCNSGNDAPVDNQPPVITIVGNNPEELFVGETFIDSGATALDAIDGVVNVTVTKNTVSTASIGQYLVEYSSTDSTGNTSSATRMVNVGAIPDLIPPELTLLGADPLILTVGDTFTDPGANAIDDIDGVVVVSVSGDTVNTEAVGQYSVIYTTSDLAGNVSSTTRQVLVNAAPDNVAPVITLIGLNPLEIRVGEIFNDPGATAEDDVDGTIDVDVAGDAVSTSAPGAFTITYSATDAAGNQTTKTRVVKVVPAVELIPPVALIGSYFDVAGKLVISGASSTSMDGATLSYVWTAFQFGSNSNQYVFSDNTGIVPVLLDTASGVTKFRLKVTDNFGQSDTTNEWISIRSFNESNEPPTISEIYEQDGNQQFPIGQSARFFAFGNDPDDDFFNLIYRYRLLSSPTGGSSEFVFKDAQVGFYIPEIVAGDYVLQAIVNDGIADSDIFTFEFSGFDLNREPYAVIRVDGASHPVGLDKEFSEEIVLDGSNSYDIEGSALTYLWKISSMPAGSQSTITNESSEIAQLDYDAIGEYEVTLTVSDGVKESFSFIRIEVLPFSGPNQPPVAIGLPSNVTIISGDPAFDLDGTQSYDIFGESLRYSWSIVSNPPDAAFELSNVTEPVARFYALTAGQYSAQLIVNDGSFESDASVININVAPRNEEIEYEPSVYSNAELIMVPISENQLRISILNEVRFDTSSKHYFNIAIDGELVDKSSFSISATSVLIDTPLVNDKITVEMWGNDEDNLPLVYSEELWLGGKSLSLVISHESRMIVSSEISLKLHESGANYNITSNNGAATFDGVHANNGIVLVSATLDDGEIVYESFLVDFRNESISLSLFIPEDFYSPAIWEKL